MILFSLERTAVREVVVNGVQVVTEGRHPKTKEIVSRYVEIAKGVHGSSQIKREARL